MLLDHLRQIRENLQAGLYKSKAEVTQGIVLRVLQALSWPTFDVSTVKPDAPIGFRTVDLGLCQPPEKLQVLIQIRPPGMNPYIDPTLLAEAGSRGVPLAVVTNGQKWRFLLPANIKESDRGMLYELDLTSQEPEETSCRLKRYLGSEEVRSGAFLKAALEDYRLHADAQKMKEALARALEALISEGDEMLLELISIKVESLFGFKPDLMVVKYFLEKFVGIKDITVEPATYNQEKEKITEEGIGFRFHGQWFPARSAREVLEMVFLKFHEVNPNFFNEFAALPTHGSRRRYLARSKYEIFPGRPDLAEQPAHVREIAPGWWLCVHLGKKLIESVIEKACKVMGIKFGSDLVVKL